MGAAPAQRDDRIRAAEVIAALSLATDLAMRFPLEHGLESTLLAMRLAERLEVDAATAWQTYHGCLLFYVGCTADADMAAAQFADDIHLHYTPAMFGSRPEIARALIRAIAPPRLPLATRATRVARTLPAAVKGRDTHLTALCEVAQMLTDRLGLPARVQSLFAALNERWDGKGHPGNLHGDELPLAVRITHVARDATFQYLLAGVEHARVIVEQRAGHAFDPAVAAVLVDDAQALLTPDRDGSAWDAVLESEPAPRVTLEGAGLDRALAACGDFADLASPYLVGHSRAVAELAAEAAQRAQLGPSDAATVRRAGLVHDLGRAAVPAGIWQKPGPLTTDEWEQVRLHPYHAERVLSRSPFLATLAGVASAHHERLDGSGYHRGSTSAALGPAARLLAAADAYQAMTEPRPHRDALDPEAASAALRREAEAGRLDADAVHAVLTAAGHTPPPLPRPAGLTGREAQVVALLARGLQTKQVAGALGISVKTADHHVQNAYGKIGVSTRAAAAMFAMEHGLVAWGELPIGRSAPPA